MSYQMTAEKLEEAGFDQSEFYCNKMTMSFEYPHNNDHFECFS